MEVINDGKEGSPLHMALPSQSIVPSVLSSFSEEATDYDWYLAYIERERERGH